MKVTKVSRVCPLEIMAACTKAIHPILFKIFQSEHKWWSDLNYHRKIPTSSTTKNTDVLYVDTCINMIVYHTWRTAFIRMCSRFSCRVTAQVSNRDLMLLFSFHNDTMTQTVGTVNYWKTIWTHLCFDGSDVSYLCDLSCTSVDLKTACFSLPSLERWTRLN